MEQNSVEGHRKRIRQKFIDTDSQGLTEKELLELLLYYSVKRSDTKPIVKSLFERYGDLDAIFDADLDGLMSVEGVGRSSAEMILLAGEIIKYNRVESGEAAAENPDLLELKAFAAGLFENEDRPRLDAILFDMKKRIINVSTVLRDGVGISEEEKQKLFKLAADEPIDSVILVLYRPTDGYMPQSGDIELLKKCKKSVEKYGCSLSDFIIVGKDGTFSLANDLDYYKYF